jgi:uncharacterized protein (TIGR02118 family)
MHKLVILVESTDDPSFDENWPEFLHMAERMPGLQRESTSRVDHVVFGKVPYAMIHELFFDSLEALQKGMASPQGQEAGRLLQVMTQGNLTLLFAEHKEDDLENIRKYQKPEDDDAIDALAG